MSILEKLFKIQSRGSSISNEFFGALTIYLTASYVFLVVPNTLSVTHIPFSVLFTATCLIVGITTLIIGFVTNMPIFVAPTMGYISYFAYVILPEFGLTNSFIIIISIGVILSIIAITPIHKWLVKGMPDCIRHGYITSLGIFIFFIGLQNMGISIANKETLVAVGSFLNPKILVGLGVFLFIFVLYYYKNIGFILIPLIIGLIISIFLNIQPFTLNWGMHMMNPLYHWFYSPSPVSFSFSMMAVIIALSITVFFDNDATFRVLTRDTFTSALYKKAMITTYLSIILSGIFGLTTTGMYLETKAGIDAKAKTGLTSVFMGIFAFATLFLLPIASSIPSYLTATALMYIGLRIVAGHIVMFDFSDLTKWIPGILTALILPLTFSITSTLMVGFVFYVLLNVFTKKWKEIHPYTYVLTVLLVGSIILGVTI